jgi:hypothetical protein
VASGGVEARAGQGFEDKPASRLGRAADIQPEQQSGRGDGLADRLSTRAEDKQRQADDADERRNAVDGPTPRPIDPVSRFGQRTAWRNHSVEQSLLGTFDPVKGQWRRAQGVQMIGIDGERLPGLVGEQIVYAALDAIDQALEQALTARSETQRRREFAQLRGMLLTLPHNGLGLERALRRLIITLREPMPNR